MKKIYFYLLTASISLIVLIFFALFSFKDDKLHLVICDVGQGDAIFITTPAQVQILIDGGPDKAVLDCLGRHMSFWDRSLDAVILTHPHADHLTGLIDVVERYKLSGFYKENVSADTDIYHLLEAKLAEKNVSAKDLYLSNNFKEKSGVEVSTLWPSLETIYKTDQNNTNLDLNGLSVVSLITYGNFSVLLTGDAGQKIMDEISAEAGDIDVLKVPHHGSKTGMSDSFLNSVRPEVAVISVGKKNRYGHPAPLSLKLLKEHGVKIFRTDMDGDIEIVSDGSTWSVNAEH